MIENIGGQYKIQLSVAHYLQLVHSVVRELRGQLEIQHNRFNEGTQSVRVEMFGLFL